MGLLRTFLVILISSEFVIDLIAYDLERLRSRLGSCEFGMLGHWREAWFLECCLLLSLHLASGPASNCADIPVIIGLGFKGNINPTVPAFALYEQRFFA